MKDARGLYYYPFPKNKRIHMYVRQDANGICFRMWNADDPKLWDSHDWVPFEAIQQAAAIYSGNQFDPKQAYDIDAAKALLADDDRKPSS